MKDVCYVIVPGLNDRLLLSRWLYTLGRWWLRAGGMHTEVVYMRWQNGESFAAKQQRLNDRLAQLRAAYKRVVVIGVSAGACPAMLAYQQGRGVDIVITVCGALHTTDSRRKLLETHTPDVADALLGWSTAEPRLGQAQRQKVLAIYSANDTLLPPGCARLRSAQYIELRSRGHAWSIGIGLVCHIGQIKQFVRLSL